MPGWRADSIAALKAIASGDRVDKDWVWVVDQDFPYIFDSGSSATGDDFLIVQPTSGSGRWFRAGRYKQIWRAAQAIAFSTLTDASTITPNAALSNNFYLGLTTAIGTSRAIANPTNPSNGQELFIVFKQPASPPTGGCQVTLGGKFLVRGTTFSLNPAPNSVSALSAVYQPTLDLWLTQIGSW